jgi:hypothetical protein
MGIFDPLMTRLRPKRTSPTDTLGVSGTPAYGGFLVSNERSAKLQGREKYRTYSDLLINVSIVAASTRYFLNLVAKANWKVEANPDFGDVGIQAKELVEDAMKMTDTPWYRIIRRAAMFKFQGYSIAEWTAKSMPDGRILLADIESRPQITIERWDIDETGHVAGVVQRAPKDQREIYLPRGKLLYAVDDALDDSPEGLGLLRHLAEPARRLERYMQLEGYGFEGDLQGMPIARVPLTKIQKARLEGSMTAEQERALVGPIENFLSGHVKSPALGLMLDSQPYTSTDQGTTPSSMRQWDLDLAKSDVGTQAEVAMAIERVNREMARIMGTESILLGSDGKGSLALSRDKSNNFATQIDSTLSELRDTYDKDLVETLMKLNGIPVEAKPELKTDATAYRDIEQVTTALLQMAQAGAVLGPDDPAIKEVRDQLGITMPEVIEVAPPKPNASAGAPPTPEELAAQSVKDQQTKEPQ